jgi:hypothetical protein
LFKLKKVPFCPTMLLNSMGQYCSSTLNKIPITLLFPKHKTKRFNINSINFVKEYIFEKCQSNNKTFLTKKWRLSPSSVFSVKEPSLKYMKPSMSEMEAKSPSRSYPNNLWSIHPNLINLSKLKSRFSSLVLIKMLSSTLTHLPPTNLFLSALSSVMEVIWKIISKPKRD